MYRLDKGRPLREALSRTGMSIPHLSTRTREIDPQKVGISPALIGFYTSTGSSGRDSVSTRTARLIADALGVDRDELFADDPSTPQDLRLRENGD